MIEIPEPDDGRVLRHVLCGEPSRSRILLWNTCKTLRTGSARAPLGFAFWPAEHTEPLFVSEELETCSGISYDSDETLLSVLCYVTLHYENLKEHIFSPEQAAWAASAEAEALRADIDALTDAVELFNLFDEVG